MTNNSLESALLQALIPVAKKVPSSRYSQIKPKVSQGVRSLLRAHGIGAYSPRFAAIVSRETLGEDSKAWGSLLSQGTDLDNWTYFAPGCSVESLERWKRGATASVHAACCRAVERITGEPFPVNEVSAVEPDFKAEHQALEALLNRTRTKLLSGVSTTIGITAPRWQESDHALGIPLHIDVSDINITPVKASAPFSEHSIEASYKGAQIPVGRLIFASGCYALIFDARPFLWTGEDLTIGRKRIRLVLFKGDAASHLRALVASSVELEAIAS